MIANYLIWAPAGCSGPGHLGPNKGHQYFYFERFICLIGKYVSLFTGESILNIKNIIHLWFICITTLRFLWNASDCDYLKKIICYAVFIEMFNQKCKDINTLFILLIGPRSSYILIWDEEVFFIYNIRSNNRYITSSSLYGGRLQ